MNEPPALIQEPVVTPAQLKEMTYVARYYGRAHALALRADGHVELGVEDRVVVLDPDGCSDGCRPSENDGSAWIPEMVDKLRETGARCTVEPGRGGGRLLAHVGDGHLTAEPRVDGGFDVGASPDSLEHVPAGKVKDAGAALAWALDQVAQVRAAER